MASVYEQVRDMMKADIQTVDFESDLAEMIKQYATSDEHITVFEAQLKQANEPLEPFTHAVTWSDVVSRYYDEKFQNDRINEVYAQLQNAVRVYTEAKTWLETHLPENVWILSGSQAVRVNVVDFGYDNYATSVVVMNVSTIEAFYALPSDPEYIYDNYVLAGE